MQTAFALYRLPEEQHVQLVRGAIQPWPQAEGFAFAGFSDSIPSWVITPEINTIWNGSYYDLFRKESLEHPITHIHHEYTSRVAQSVAYMQSHSELSKVVLSRYSDERALTDIEIYNLFKTLCTSYPHAFVYLVSSPETGTWTGATPETLLIKKDQAIYTVSLAGTIHATHPEWSEKEYREQQIVTDYISGCLEAFTDTLQIGRAESWNAGPVSHLRTPFNGQLRPDADVFELIQLLHPTPAVCGMPKALSLEYILTHEPFNRNYYTGFCGPVFSNQMQLFVNLRCAEYTQTGTRLYAGAGITAQSKAEEEWIETEIKLKTLRTFIG